MEPKKKAIRNWAPGRLHINFPNGNHLSTVWADGTYTENNMSMTVTDFLLIRNGNTERNRSMPVIESDTVEIMFDCGPKLKKRILKKYNDGSEDPIGYLTITQWLEIVHLLAISKEPTNNT